MKLEEWFEIRSEQLRQEYCPQAEPMLSIPILVREAWETQQFHIDKIESELEYYHRKNDTVVRKLYIDFDKLKKLAQEMCENMEEYGKYGELAGIDSDLVQRAKQILSEV